MIESDEDLGGLRERLNDLERAKARRNKPSRAASLGKALGGVAAIAALGLGSVYVAQQAREQGDEPLGTSEAAAFQGTGEGFGSLDPAPAAALPADPPPEVEPAAAPAPEPGPSLAEQALLQTLEELREEMAAMRAAEDAAPEPVATDVGSDRVDELARQLGVIQAETASLRDQASDADLKAQQDAAEIARLQTELRIAQAGGTGSATPAATTPANTPGARGIDQGQGSTGQRIVDLGTSGGGGQNDREAERLAELEQRRQEAADFLDARINSPLVAVGGSGGPGEGETAPGDAGGSGLGQNEDFVRASARTAEVEQAVVIANPSRTVIQGTLVQAVMETAIDSSLPGAIRAVVSEDVHSYDGSRILIPRGSKLIGRYNSQVEPTQRRLMIAWDRIITPDSQSVTISAYGADELGRSGTTGRIDRRLGTRFGSAALVSIISAVPAAAGAAVRDPVAAELAEALGENAEDVAGSVLDQYLSVPPTIYIDQGARITVLVDRDLELL